MKKYFLIIFFLGIASGIYGQIKVLYDATKAEMAGNADWIIDADTFDIGFSNGVLHFNGNESNPQRFPTPEQSSITTTTAENYWTGGISAWAIDVVKLKYRDEINEEYQVETLPVGGRITYGDTTNDQDLSIYDIFVVPEPNYKFTDDEKTAIYNFIKNGGGLFLISDHDESDRDGDGYDSVDVWDDFLDNAPLGYNPFGIHINYDNITEASSSIADLPGNPILFGEFGEVTTVEFYNGTTFSIDYTENQDATALVFRKNQENNYNQVMIASSTYGAGKILAVGDSSIIDDGSGDSHDRLYDGWIEDANGNHRKLIMNAVLWMSPGVSSVEKDLPGHVFRVYMKPDHFMVINPEIHVNLNLFSVSIYNMEGREILSDEKIRQENGLYLNLPEGIYLFAIKMEGIIIQTGKIILD
jgi:hypothetical protein